MRHLRSEDFRAGVQLAPQRRLRAPFGHADLRGRLWKSSALSTIALAAAGVSAEAGENALWQPQIQTIFGGDENGAYTALEAFIPLMQDADSVFFLDLRFKHDFSSDSGQDYGLGFRQVVNPDLILGGYGYLNVGRFGGHQFTGATLGVEAIGSHFDAHVNVHVPFEKEDIESRGEGSTLSLVGNQLIEQISLVEERDYASWGIEGEVGIQTPIDLPQDHSLRLHFGGFHFDDASGSAGSVTGGKAGFEYRVDDLFGKNSAALVFGAEVRHDSRNDTNFAGSIRLSIPLGGPDKAAEDPEPVYVVSEALRKRANERVRGDIGLRLGSEESDRSTSRIAINHLTGQAFGDFFFADGENTLGLGTIGDPTTLDDAVAQAGEDGFVVALGGEGNLLTNGITLSDGQTVIGGGQSVQARLMGESTGTPFALGGTDGTIEGSNPASAVITLAEGSALTGITLTGGGDGIFGDGVSAMLTDVTVTGAGANGFSFTGDDTEIEAGGLTATGNGGHGLAITGDGDYDFDGTTLLSDNGIDGLNIAGDGSYEFETLDLIDNADDGAEVTSTTGELTIQDGTVSGNGDIGVKIDPITLDVTFASITHAGGSSGIVLDDVQGSFTVTGATAISNTSGAGIAISNSAAEITFNGVTISDSGAGILVGGANAGSIAFDGATAIANPTGNGIDLSGATGASLAFDDLTISGLGGGAGLNFASSRVSFSADTLAITGTDAAGSTGIDLSGTQAGSVIAIGTGMIGDVDTGVQLGANGAAGLTANADFTFGGGSITGNTASLDMRGLSPAAGAYDFGPTAFGGPQLFDTTGALFIGSAATGAGNGSSVNDLATIDFADALTDTGLIFALVNDGAAITDADGFTLSAGQTLASFGDGRTFSAGGAPANVTGDNIIAGVEQDDPTGLGAATLTSSGAAATVALADGSAMLDLVVSNSGAGAGIVGANVVNVVLSGVTVSGAGQDGVQFSGASVVAADDLISTGNGGSGLSIVGDGDYSFTGVTTLSGNAADGLSGASSATLSFDALDITGVGAGQTGIDLSGGRTSLSVAALSIAGTGGAGSTGIDLSATQAGTTVDIGTIDVAGVDSGVQLGTNGAGGATANATLTIGGGQIGGATAALDLRGLSPTSGDYAFGPTVFNGAQLFDPTNIVFVAETATGAGDGSSVNDRATIDFADVITTGGAIFALINDGDDIVDDNGFTLSDGQILASFGNGRTFNVGGAPINVTGDNIETGVTVADPTGNGAATLTGSTAGGTVTLADNTLVADIVLGNAGVGPVLFDDGVSDVTVTGVIIDEAGGDAIVLNNVIGDVSVSNVSIGQFSTPAGDAIRIENQQVGSTIAFTDLAITTDQAGGIVLENANGAVAFTNVEVDHSGPGLALDVQGGAGSLTIDGGNFEARHGAGIRFDGADGVYQIDTAVLLDGSGIGLDILDSSGSFAFADMTIVNTALATTLGTEIGFGAAGIGVDIRDSAGATTTIARLAVTAPDIALAARMGGTVSIGSLGMPNVFTAGFGTVAVDSDVSLVDVTIIGGNGTDPGFLIATGGVALAPGRQYGVLAEARALETSLSMAAGSAAGAGGFGAFNASGGSLIVDVSGVELSSISTEGFRAEATGAGQTFITGFDGVTIDAGLGGAAFSGVTFDADPSTAAIETVSGAGATVIGSAGARIAGTGLSIAGSTGAIEFGTLSIFTNGGAGLDVLGATGDPAALMVGASGGTIDAVGEAAMVVSSVTLDATFDAVSSYGAVDVAVDLFEVAGALTINGGAISGPVADGVLLTEVSADVTLSGMTINTPDFFGVHIVDPIGGATTTINSTVIDAGDAAIILETTVDGSDGKIAVTGGDYSGDFAGLDVVPGHPGNYEVAISGGNFVGGLGAIVIDGCACQPGDILITEFGGFTVLDPGTAGVVVNLAEFAVTTAGGPITIGSAADPAAFGLLMVDVTGTLNVSDLDITAAFGPALGVDNFFQPDASTFQFTIAGGDITATNGEALYLDNFTADITLDTVSSTAALFDAGLLLLDLSGTFDVIGAVTVTDSSDDGIHIVGGDADFTFGGPVSVTNAGDDGIDIDGLAGSATFLDAVLITTPVGDGMAFNDNAGTLTFNDVVIDTPGAAGIDFNGVNGTATFGDVDITGLGANGVGLELFGSLVNLTMASLDVTGASAVGSIGIDLRDTQAGTTVDIVGGGQIGGVGTGVILGTAGSFVETANADFTFGGGRIEGADASIDARGLLSTSGDYAFGTTVLVGPQLFDGGNLFFVGSVASGTGDGSSYDNRATIAAADALTGANLTFVLVNDGADIVDADGFTLSDNQSLASFGNGRTVMVGGLPINVTGDNVINGVAQGDDLGNGAARLTTGGAIDTITLGNDNFVADLVVSNSGTGDAIQGLNVANLSGTGITIDSGAAGLNLEGVTGAVTLADTTVLGAIGDGINITTSSASFSFTGTTSVSGTGAEGVELSGANGAITFDNLVVNGGSQALWIVNATADVTVLDGSIGATTPPTLAGVLVSGQAATSTISFTGFDVTVPNVSAVNLTDNAGVVVIDGGTIFSAGGDGIISQNTNLTARNLTISSVGAGAHGFDISATGATTSTVVIDNVTTSLAGVAGSAVNVQSTTFGVLTVDISDSTLRSTDTALNVAETAGATANRLVLAVDDSTFQTNNAVETVLVEGGILSADTSSLVVTSFSGNTVEGGTLASGVAFTEVAFDADPALAGRQTVIASGTTQIGTSGARVAGDGIRFLLPSGGIDFATLNIFNDGGDGLTLDTGIPPTATNFTLGTGAGTIDTTDGTAISLGQGSLFNMLTVDMTLTAVSSTNGAYGIFLDEVGGTFEILGDVSIQNAVNRGIQIADSTVTAGFATNPGSSVVIDMTAGTSTGIDLSNNTAGTYTFGATTIAAVGANRRGVDVADAAGFNASFASLDIALVDDTSTGMDFSGATIGGAITVADFDLTSESGTGTTGIDLQGATGAGSIVLGTLTDPATGSSSVIDGTAGNPAGPQTGVMFSSATDVAFTFGDGEAAEDVVSTIRAVRPIDTIDTLPNLGPGRFNFLDVQLIGDTQLLEGPSVFVVDTLATAGAGTFADPGTIAQAEASGAEVIVLVDRTVNAAIDSIDLNAAAQVGAGDNTLDLADGQVLISLIRGQGIDVAPLGASSTGAPASFQLTGISASTVISAPNDGTIDVTRPELTTATGNTISLAGGAGIQNILADTTDAGASSIFGNFATAENLILRQSSLRGLSGFSLDLSSAAAGATAAFSDVAFIGRLSLDGSAGGLEVSGTNANRVLNGGLAMNGVTVGVGDLAFTQVISASAAESLLFEDVVIGTGRRIDIDSVTLNGSTRGLVLDGITGDGTLLVAEGTVNATAAGVGIDIAGSNSADIFLGTVDTLQVNNAATGIRINQSGAAVISIGTGLGHLELGRTSAPTGVGIDIQSLGTGQLLLGNAGVASTIESGGSAISLGATAGDVVVTNVALESTGASGLIATNYAGSATFDGLTINGVAGSGDAVSIVQTAGASDFDFTDLTIASSVAGWTGDGIDVSVSGGGTVDATIANLDVTTGAGAGFLWSGAGTLAITGANTVSTAAGTALGIDGVTVGAAGIVFDTITKTGAGTGIVLTNVSGGGAIDIASAVLNGITVTGVDLSGTIAPDIAFGDLDIALAGGGGAIAFDASGAVINSSVSAGDFDVTNAGAPGATIGVDLAGTTGSGSIVLGGDVASGANATINGVFNGVRVSATTDLGEEGAAAGFVFGDGLAPAESEINSAGQAITGTLPTNGNYDFDDVNFGASDVSNLSPVSLYYVAPDGSSGAGAGTLANPGTIGGAEGSNANVIVLIDNTADANSTINMANALHSGVDGNPNSLNLDDGQVVISFGSDGPATIDVATLGIDAGAGAPSTFSFSTIQSTTVIDSPDGLQVRPTLTTNVADATVFLPTAGAGTITSGLDSVIVSNTGSGDGVFLSSNQVSAFAIRDSTITAAANNAIDIFTPVGTATADTLVLSIDGTTLQAGGGNIAAGFGGINLSATTSTLAIRSFADNVVVGGTGSGGILFDNVHFDGGAAAGDQPVNGGTIEVGTTAARVQGYGINFVNPIGTLNFTTLDVANDGGTGIIVDAKTTTFTLGSTGGAVDTTNGTALDLDPLTVDMTLSSVTSTGGVSGIIFDQVAGNFTVTGATSISGTTGFGINAINTNTGTFTFNGAVTIDNNAVGNGGGIGWNSGTLVTAGQADIDTTTGIGVSQTGGTVTFSGGVTVDTTTGTGIASTGGAFNVAAAGTRTVTVSGAGTAVSLANVAANINLTSTSSAGGANNVALTNVTGAVNLGTGALSGATGTAFTVSGGSANIDYNGTITHSANGIAIVIQNHTGTGGGGSTVSFDGAITSNSSSDGISLVNNDGTNGTTINFTNTLTLNTSASNSTAFSATDGGTVTATGTGSTINSGSGTALNVVNTNIGAAGLTFQSISANGGANGIVLSNTGTTAGVHGGLTITGTGVANSGGVIQNMTGADNSGATPGGTGIVLSNTRGVSLSRMNLHDFSNYAIRGTGVIDFVLADSTINGVNGTTVASPFRDSAIRLDNLTGTVNILRNEITGGRQHNVLIDNQSGTLNLNFLQNNVHHTNATDGDDGFHLEAELTARVLANVSNNTFTAHGGDHFNLSLINDANVDLTFTGNDMQGGHALGLGQGVFILGANFNGQFRYDISNNGTLADPFVGNRQGGAIHVNKGSGAGTFSGRITNNVIGNPAVVGSGSSEASGIIVGARGAGGSHTTLISGNHVRQYFDRGIVAEAGEGAPTLNITVTNNTVSNFADAVNSLHGIHFDFGILATDNATIRIDVQDNLIANAGNEAGGGGDFRMRVAANNDVFIAGYTGGNVSANAQAFIGAENPDGTSFSVTQAAAGTYNNLAAGGVPLPTLPTLPPAPLMAAPGSGAGGGLWAGMLSGDTLDAMIAAAIGRWASTGISEEQFAALNATTFEIADLGGSYLGLADGNAIRIDNDAAGNGWFVDLTPLDDEEFGSGAGTGMSAAPESELANQYDLLTTIMHELGHVLGYGDTYAIDQSATLMYGWLSQGERRLPERIASSVNGLETVALDE